MSYQKLIKDAQSQQFKPVYVLHGEEPFFIDKISEAIIANALTEAERSFNQTILYGKETEFKTVVDNARQFPMMAQRRLVVLKEAQEMRTLSNLESYVSNPSPQTVLLIAHKHKKLDMRTKFAKSLGAHAEVFESKKLYDNQVPQWIGSYVQSQNRSIDPQASMLLAEYLGSDLSRITTELDKLQLHVESGGVIDSKIIQEYVGISKDYNVFELQKALGDRDSVKAFRIIKYFDENPKSNPLVLVLGNLYSYFTKLLLFKENSGKRDQEILSAMGMSPRAFGFLKEYRIAAANYSFPQLQNVIRLLAEADRKSKGISGRNLSTKAVLQEFIGEVL